MPSEKVPTVKLTKRVEEGAVSKGLAQAGAGQAAFMGGEVNQQQLVQGEGGDDDDDAEEPKLTLFAALLTLVISTVFVGLCSDYMVDGIGAVAASGVSPGKMAVLDG